MTAPEGLLTDKDELDRCDELEREALAKAERNARDYNAERATSWALVALAAGQRARRIGDWMS
jgi:hypothetical protein